MFRHLSWFPILWELFRYSLLEGALPAGYSLGGDGSSYKFYSSKTTWSDANVRCERDGAHLVIDDSNQVHQYLRKFKAPFWIGVNEIRKENQWMYVDGRKAGKTFWDSGQPGDNGRDEDCVGMWSSYRWHDIGCGDRYAFVCQSKASPHQDMGCWADTGIRAIPPLEGRGISKLNGNYWTRANAIAKCYNVTLEKGFKYFAVQNGGWCASSVTAGATYKQYGVSTECKGDGKGGYSASRVYRIIGPDFWNYVRGSDGFYYKYYASRLNWEKARGKCLSEGAYLAFVNSTETFNYIYTTYRNNGEIWIGLNTITSNMWQWDNGKAVTNTFWHTSEQAGRGFCTVTNGKRNGGRWYVSSCSVSKSFLCQKEAPSNYTKGSDGSYYRYFSYGATWKDANSRCNDDGAQLVMIDSEDVRKYLQTTYHSTYWIGVHRLNGIWRGVNGRPVNNTYWNFGQSTSGDCVAMSNTSSWDAVSCSERKPFLCQIKALPAGYNNGSDGNFYKYYSLGETWQNASSRCNKDGAQLAIVDSDAVYKYLSQTFKLKSFWIGVVWIGELDKQGTWRFTDGKDVKKTYWYGTRKGNGKGKGKGKGKHYPSNVGSSRCVYWRYKNKWSNTQCDGEKAFLCQIKGIKDYRFSFVEKEEAATKPNNSRTSLLQFAVIPAFIIIFAMCFFRQLTRCCGEFLSCFCERLRSLPSDDICFPCKRIWWAIHTVRCPVCRLPDIDCCAPCKRIRRVIQTHICESGGNTNPLTPDMTSEEIRFDSSDGIVTLNFPDTLQVPPYHMFNGIVNPIHNFDDADLPPVYNFDPPSYADALANDPPPPTYEAVRVSTPIAS